MLKSVQEKNIRDRMAYKFQTSLCEFQANQGYTGRPCFKTTPLLPSPRKETSGSRGESLENQNGTQQGT